MKPKEEQSKLWFLSVLTCELPVVVNLKLLAAKTRRRLSLNGPLSELLVLTDLEVEMAQKKKGKKRKKT